MVRQRTASESRGPINDRAADLGRGDIRDRSRSRGPFDEVDPASSGAYRRTAPRPSGGSSSIVGSDPVLPRASFGGIARAGVYTDAEGAVGCRAALSLLLPAEASPYLKSRHFWGAVPPWPLYSAAHWRWWEAGLSRPVVTSGSPPYRPFQQLPRKAGPASSMYLGNCLANACY